MFERISKRYSLFEVTKAALFGGFVTEVFGAGLNGGTKGLREMLQDLVISQSTSWEF